MDHHFRTEVVHKLWEFEPHLPVKKLVITNTECITAKDKEVTKHVCSPSWQQLPFFVAIAPASVFGVRRLPLSVQSLLVESEQRSGGAFRTHETR